MTRREADFSRPLRILTWGEIVTISIAAIVPAFLLLVMLVALLFSHPARAHDSWISRGGLKNAAGEWCCGDYDCKTYMRAASKPTGWFVEGELVPFDEAMPIAPPDGELVVCRRPDGSRRCVFGIKPGL